MFCPRCGQERFSQDTSFCSRCGFLLTAAAELLLTEGIPGANLAAAETLAVSSKEAPRWRGVKQGLFLILLTIVLAPLLGLILRYGLNMMPWPMGVFIFLFGGAGILRIAYALLFKSGTAEGTLSQREEWKQNNSVGAGRSKSALPSADISSFVPPEPLGSSRWLETNDLEPPSVTDPTTRLLEKEHD